MISNEIDFDSFIQNFFGFELDKSGIYKIYKILLILELGNEISWNGVKL